MHPLGLLLICLYIRFVSVKIQIRVQLQLGSYGFASFLATPFHNTKQVGSTVPMPLDPYKTCWDPAGRSCSSSSDLCFTSFRLTDKNLVDKNQWPSGLEIPWAMDFVSKISGASQTFLYRMASLPLYFSSNASKKFTQRFCVPKSHQSTGSRCDT